MRTSNIERRTSNVERSVLALLILVLGGITSLAEKPESLEHAALPLTNGVPQVAVVRLQALLRNRLSTEERREATAKLGEALVVAGQAEDALKILVDPIVRDLPRSQFFRAQALAALSRWSDAQRLYQQ